MIAARAARRASDRLPRGSLPIISIIFLLALIPRLLWAYGANTNAFYDKAYHARPVDYATPNGVDDLTFYLQSAHSIAEGNGYREPFHATPTARYPPGWPAILSIFDRIFGEHALPPATFNAVLGATTCVATFLLGARLFGRAAGVGAAVILAYLPSHVLLAAVLRTEIIFTLLCSVVLLVALEAPSIRRTVALGLLIGVSALIRGEAVFLPIALLFILRWHGAEWRMAFRHTVIMSAVAFAVLAPWAARNSARFGSPVLLTTQTGVNLMLGRMPQKGVGPDFAAFFAVAQPYRSEAEPQRQIDIERASYRKAWQRVVHHPLGEVALVPSKLRHLFQNDPVWGSDDFIIGGLWRGPVTFHIARWISQVYYDLALAGFALMVALRGGERAIRPILAMTALWSFVFGAVFFGLDRYHMPLLPLFAVGAAVGWRSLLRLAWEGMRSLVAKPATSVT
jgi:4-amino-4-deoxy-L-arabinose transferase-like glycosyltransferase